MLYTEKKGTAGKAGCSRKKDSE